jgi:hypothetical protein
MSEARSRYCSNAGKQRTTRDFADGCGQGSLILMQMAINFGYKIALENLQIEYEQESII